MSTQTALIKRLIRQSQPMREAAQARAEAAQNRAVPTMTQDQVFKAAVSALRKDQTRAKKRRKA